MSVKPFRSIRRVGSVGRSGDVLTLGSHISSSSAHPIYVKKGDRVGALNLTEHLADDAPHVDYVIQRKEFLTSYSEFNSAKNAGPAQYRDLESGVPVPTVISAPLLYTILAGKDSNNQYYLKGLNSHLLFDSDINAYINSGGQTTPAAVSVPSLLRFDNLKNIVAALVSGVYTGSVDGTATPVTGNVTTAQYQSNPFSRLFAYVGHNHDDRYSLKTHTHEVNVSGYNRNNMNDGSCTIGSWTFAFKAGDVVLVPSWQGHTHKQYADDIAALDVRVGALENTGEDSFIRGMRTSGIYPNAVSVRKDELTIGAGEELEEGTSFGYDFNKIIAQGAQVLFISKQDAEDEEGHDLTHLPTELITAIKEVNIADASDGADAVVYADDMHTSVAVKVTSNNENLVEFGVDDIYNPVRGLASKNFVFRSVRQLVTSDPGIANNPRIMSSAGLSSEAIQEFWKGTHGVYWRAGMSLAGAWYIESVLKKCLDMTPEEFYTAVNDASDPVKRIAELLYSAIDNFDESKYADPDGSNPELVVGYYTPDIRSAVKDGSSVDSLTYQKRALRPDLAAVAAGLVTPIVYGPTQYFQTYYGSTSGRKLSLNDASMWLTPHHEFLTPSHASLIGVDAPPSYDYRAVSGTAANYTALFADRTLLVGYAGKDSYLHSDTEQDAAGTSSNTLFYPGYLRMHDISVTHGTVDPDTAINPEVQYTIDGSAAVVDQLTTASRPYHRGSVEDFEANSFANNTATVTTVYDDIAYNWSGKQNYCTWAWRKLKNGTALTSGVSYYAIRNASGSSWNVSTNKLQVTASNVGTTKLAFTLISGTPTTADNNTWVLMPITDAENNLKFRRKIYVTSPTNLDIANGKYYYYGMDASGNTSFVAITSAEASAINSTGAPSWLQSKFNDANVTVKPISGHIYERLDIKTITAMVGLGSTVNPTRAYVKIPNSSTFAMPLSPDGVQYFKLKSGTPIAVSGFNDRIAGGNNLTWDTVDPTGARQSEDIIYAAVDYYGLTASSGAQRETPAFFFKYSQSSARLDTVLFKMSALFNDGTRTYRRFTQEYTYMWDKGDDEGNYGTTLAGNAAAREAIDTSECYEHVGIERLCDIYMTIKQFVTEGAAINPNINGASPLVYNFTYDGKLITWGRWDKIVTEATARYALSDDLNAYVKKSIYNALMARVSSIETNISGVDASGTVSAGLFRIHVKDFPNAEEIKAWTHVAGDATTSPYQQVSIDLAGITIAELEEMGNIFDYATWKEMNFTDGTVPYASYTAISGSAGRYYADITVTSNSIYVKNKNTGAWNARGSKYAETPTIGVDIETTNNPAVMEKVRSGDWFAIAVPPNSNRFKISVDVAASSSTVVSELFFIPHDAEGRQFGTGSANGGLFVLSATGSGSLVAYYDLPDGVVTVEPFFRVTTPGGSATWSNLKIEPQVNLSRITTADVSFELETTYLSGATDRFKPLAKYTYIVDGEQVKAIGEPRFHLNTYSPGTSEEYKRIAITLPDNWYVGAGTDPTTGFTEWNSLASMFEDSNVNKVALYAIIRKVGEIVGGNSAPR